MESRTTTAIECRSEGKKRRSTLRSVTSALAISALMFGSYATASAQDTEVEADDAEAVLDAITVTAKNRVQNLQDVPLSISVLSQEDIIKNSIFDIRDLAQLTPSFNFVSGTGRTDPTALAIRGLAPNTSDERFQGVSFFVDGIALSGQLTGIDLTQLEGVEVVRGPQSALFGRATYSGAVNYKTRNPVTDRLTGNFRVRLAGTDTDDFAGDTDLSYLVGGRVDFPIIPGKLWGSVNASQRVDGAFAESPVNQLDIGEEETFSVGGVLYAEPTSNWSMKARVAFDKEDDSVPFSQVLSQRATLNAGLPLVPLPRSPATLIAGIAPDPILGLTAPFPSGLGSLAALGITEDDIGTERDRLLVTFLTDYTLPNSGIMLSYKGGYFNSDRTQVNDFGSLRDNTAAPNNADPIVGDLINSGVLTNGGPFPFQFAEEFENTSHQFLVLSPDSGRFRWQAGVYYFYEQATNTQLRNAGVTNEVGMVNPNGQTRGRDVIDNFAVFGQIEYDITDRLTASFEGRWQTEDVSLVECQTCVDPTNQTFESEENDFLPRFTLDYQATDNTLLYALYSEGVKSARLSSPINVGATVNGGFDSPVLASPEDLQNYEIGIKNVFLDGRALINLSGFYSDVEDQQIFSTNQTVLVNGEPVGVGSAAVNVGESRIIGFEVETEFDVTDKFLLTGNVGYANQEFTSDEPFTVSNFSTAPSLPPTDAIIGVGNQDGNLNNDPIIIDGFQQANVPQWTASFAASYDYELWNGNNLNLRLDTNYRGKFFANLGNVTEVRDAWTLGFRASYEMEYGTISLFARNLTNQDRATVGNLAGGTSGCPRNEPDTATFGSSAGDRCVFSSRARPRTIGVELVANF